MADAPLPVTAGLLLWANHHGPVTKVLAPLAGTQRPRLSCWRARAQACARRGEARPPPACAETGNNRGARFEPGLERWQARPSVKPATRVARGPRLRNPMPFDDLKVDYSQRVFLRCWIIM